MTRLIAWPGLLLSALFLLTTGGTYPGIASVEGHIIGQVIAYAVLGSWLVLALRRPEWRPTTPLILPVVVASFAYLLSFLFSQRPRLSLEPTLAGLGWAVAFLFLTTLLARPWFRARTGVLLTAFVAVVAFGYLGQVAIDWWTWWGLIGRFAVPPLRPNFDGLFLGSPNLIATALMLATPLVVAIQWSRPGGRRLAIVLAVASGLAAFVSGSRGAYLGIGLGAALAVVLVVLRGGARSAVGTSVDRLRARPILILPVLAVVAGAAVFTPSIVQRFAQGGADLRFDLWRSAATIFAEHPITGGGPGTWVQLKIAANPPGVPNLILPHAHDMYVQAAAELGIVGLLALAWLAVAVVRRLWTGWHSTDRGLSLEVGAVLVGLVSVGGQSIVDNFSNLPLVVLLAVLSVAWIDGRLGESERAQSPARVPAGGRRVSAMALGLGTVLVAFVALIPGLLTVDTASLRSSAGDAKALAGDWPGALADYQAAWDTDKLTLYELQLAGALARVGRIAEARNTLEDAVRLDPVAMNVIGLAALDAEVGDTEAARSHLRQAVASGVGEPAVALNAGLVAERIGDLDTALDQFASAIAWDPPLASADLWTSSTARLSKDEVVAAARVRTGPLDGALMVAYVGQVSAARAEIEAMPASPTRDAYLAMVTGLGGDTASALARFDALLDANPSDWFAAAMAARTAHRAGKETAADRYRRWAIAVQGDAAPGVISEASVVPASADDPWAGLPLNYPWAIYLRPDSPSVSMPEVTNIGAR